MGLLLSFLFLSLAHAGYCDISTVHAACIQLGSTSNQNPESNTDRQVEAEAEVLSILNGLDSTHHFSDKFKMAFARSTALAAVAFLDSEGEWLSDLRLPFPANSKSAPLKNLTREEFKNLFSSLPKTAQERLKVLAASQMEEWKRDTDQPVETIDLPNPEQKEKVEKIFTETKANLIESIQRGRPESALSEGEISMIRRIESVRFEHPTLEYAAQECDGGGNASYIAKGHKVVICPAFYQETSNHIAFILGHEIGHSMDPCLATYPIYSEQNGTKFSSGATMGWAPPNGKIYATAIPDGKHPLKDVEKCLVSKEGMREVTVEDLKAAAALESVFYRYEENMPDSQFQKHREVNIKAASSNPRCSGNRLLQSELNEYMGDIYGRVALESYLKDHPIQVKSDAAASIPFIASICKDKDPKREEMGFARYAIPHPLYGKRATGAIQIPSLAKALQCQPNPATFCENEMLAYAAKKPARAVEVQAPVNQAPATK